MKLLSGKRIGQSGYELVLAVFFSFFLHAAVVAAALLLYMTVTPKVYVPPFYEVKLVGAPAEIAPLPQATQSPPSMEAPPKTEAPAPPKPTAKKALPKLKKGPPKATKALSKKGAMPELNQKPKAAVEQEKPAEAPGETTPGPKSEGVAVQTPQQDFKFPWYLGLVREKIGQNWRPPPDAQDAKARVIFKINRSGWVGEVNLDEEHSVGTYGFKAAAIRAIRSSNPFPPLPEDFAKQTLEFSVDLMAE